MLVKINLEVSKDPHLNHVSHKWEADCCGLLVSEAQFPSLIVISVEPEHTL